MKQIRKKAPGNATSSHNSRFSGPASCSGKFSASPSHGRCAPPSRGEGGLYRLRGQQKYRSREALLAVMLRRNEISNIVAWMDARVGPGWKKRMEERDRYMNQNIPPRWVRGSVRPLQRSVERLRAYAARFGYGQISACRNSHPSGQWVDLAKALDRLADLKT